MYKTKKEPRAPFLLPARSVSYFDLRRKTGIFLGRFVQKNAGFAPQV
jgi:hypothetical protein